MLSRDWNKPWQETKDDAQKYFTTFQSQARKWLDGDVVKREVKQGSSKLSTFFDTASVPLENLLPSSHCSRRVKRRIDNESRTSGKDSSNVTSIVESVALSILPMAASFPAGVALAMMPAVNLKMAHQNHIKVEKSANVPMMPGVQLEDERFAELIFPGFDENSFIWKLSLAQCAQFFVSMLMGNAHAAPETCSLYLLGASWGPAIASGQLWRLIMPTMLHANMMHLFFNIFFQLRIGFGMEKQFGKSKFILLYIMCGILGNLISISIDPFKLAVGASTSGFGLIGVWLAEIALSWHVMGPHRERTIVWILFMLVAVVMMSSVAANIDIFGHLGGALAGFLLAIILSDMEEEHQPTWYSWGKRGAALSLLALISICALKIAIFTPRLPIPNCGSLFSPKFSSA